MIPSPPGYQPLSALDHATLLRLLEQACGVGMRPFPTIHDQSPRSWLSELHIFGGQHVAAMTRNPPRPMDAHYYNPATMRYHRASNHEQL